MTYQLFRIRTVFLLQTAQTEVLYNLLGRDMMSLVILHLFHSPTTGLVDGELHGGGDGVGIHDDLAIDVSGSAPCGLRETAMAAQETFLVGIEDGHEGYFGQVQTLTQQVDAHQDIVDPLS